MTAVKVEPSIDAIDNLPQLKKIIADAQRVIAEATDRIHTVGMVRIAAIRRDYDLPEATQPSLPLPAMASNGKRKNGNGGKHATARAKVKAKKAKPTVGKVRYRNPDDHDQTWTGRGTRPRWFKGQLARGVTPEQMQAH